jgi:hypothetical protein
MKTRNILKGAAIWLAAFCLFSCEDDLEQPLPAETPIVQFADSQIIIHENQSEKQIVLKLSKPAQHTGILSMAITSSHLAKFSTEPANSDGRLEVPIAKGSSSIAFLIKPLNDQQKDGDETLSASISGVSSGFKIGTQRSLSVSIVDDDQPIIDRVEANFPAGEVTIGEQASQGQLLTVSLSAPAPATGQIGIVFSSDDLQYGIDFITEPAAENTKITLPVAEGSTQVSFKFIPMQNNTWQGDRGILFTLTNGLGSIKIGQAVVLQLKISDDEIAPKIKGYETVAGSWRTKRVYEYGYDNQLEKITWEQYTPAYQGGTFQYEYLQGRLHKMIENANRETYYEWEGGRIVKEEQYTNGLLSKYVIYNYDQAGNIGEAAYHYRQPNGSYKMGLLIVYLYFTDGNLYKKMVFNPANSLNNPTLVSTVTYENYLDVENPFPLEILPNVNSQPKLPGSYREEANGSDLNFEFTYEFDGMGRPVKRTASSSRGSETTTYLYN